jgi:hypothetical protein
MPKSALRNLPLPFITTAVATDIAVFFALLPLWVVTGITPFLGPVLMVFLVFKLMFIYSRSKQGFAIPFSLFSAMLAFLLFSLVSGLHIQDEPWVYLFVRNLAVYAGALGLFLVVVNVAKTEPDLLKILRGLDLMVLLACLVGLAAILGLIPIRPGLPAPISYILPERIRTSEYLSKMIVPNFGDYIRLELFNIRVRRINSLFPYANLFAAALIIALPFELFLLNLSSGRRRMLARLKIFLIFVNLFFTYSRGAVLALLFGMLYIGFLRVKRFLGFLQRPAVVLATVCVLLVFLFFLVEPVFQSKSTSTSVRLFIYEKTIESWKESPLFGWGTPRNIIVDGEPSKKHPPLGSHSQFLAVLYRYGLVGFILYGTILGLVFREVRKISRLARNDGILGNLGVSAGWAFFLNLVHQVFIVMDFDIIVLYLIWMNWGIIVAVRTMLEKRAAAGPAPAGAAAWG